MKLTAVKITNEMLEDWRAYQEALSVELTTRRGRSST
jgi:hypothetical protein